MHSLNSSSPSHRRWSDWLGIELSVASGKEKLIAGLGGFIAILLLIFASERALRLPHATALVASMGASAVLLFAVPHGQLSQPWPVFAGHGFSALIGVACAKWIGDPAVAAACAVGLSIAVMHHLKCIHPPGGATALTAVLGGPTIHTLGFHFVWFPVLTNAATIIAVAVAFNFDFDWRKYPSASGSRLADSHVADSPGHEQVVEALKTLDSFVDITEDDLVRLVHLLTPSPLPETKTGLAHSRAKPLRGLSRKPALK